MALFRVLAIPTPVAESVRATGKAPRYNHPVHIEVAKGYGPCRHCLRAFHVGEENRTLFTYDSFDGIESLPLPGPVFIHSDQCERYPEDGGYPEDLKVHPAVLNVYAKGPKLLDQVFTEPGEAEERIANFLIDPKVDYIEVRDRKAGCFDFRVERARIDKTDAQNVEKFKC
jgi:hypothetical protein